MRSGCGNRMGWDVCSSKIQYLNVTSPMFVLSLAPHCPNNDDYCTRPSANTNSGTVTGVP